VFSVAIPPRRWLNHGFNHNAMLLQILLFFAGLAVLYFGAEHLVKGSATTAVILGINPIVVGLTVVAFGTSMPELVVCLVAVFRDSDNIALGNVIGSNIANIGLVMALGAIVSPISIRRRTLTRDLPFMLLFTFVSLAMAYTGVLTRAHGAILLAGLAGFTGLCAYEALRKKKNGAALKEEVGELVERNRKLTRELAVTAAGMGGVVLGAHFLVESATAIARALGISELVIGMTVVAVGTSLPELATTAVAAFRRQSDIAVGNVIGSNIFNIGSVLALTALAKPIPVAREILTGEMVVMTAFSLALIPVAIRLEMGRVAGALFLTGYAAFIAWTVVYRLGVG